MIILAWVISTILWLAFWLPAYVLGFLINWLGLLGRGRSAEHMWFPWWFWDSNAGINGTLNYQNLNWVISCNPQINWAAAPDQFALAKSIVDAKTGNERNYGNRWIWITFRNPVTNLSRWVIGRGAQAYTSRTWSFGPFSLQRLTVTLGWSYAFTLSYGFGRGFFYRFGWKYDDIQQGRACFMYRISPWKQL